jgi:hypothetical protein
MALEWPSVHRRRGPSIKHDLPKVRSGKSMGECRRCRRALGLQIFSIRLSDSPLPPSRSPDVAREGFGLRGIHVGGRVVLEGGGGGRMLQLHILDEPAPGFAYSCPYSVAVRIHVTE